MNNSAAAKTIRVLSKQKALIAIIAILVIMVVSSEASTFYTVNNLFQILNTASTNIILAAGVTFVILCGGCDLSIGGMLSLSGIIAILLMEYMPIAPAMICGVAFGAGIGFVNGFLIAHQKTDSFIITLGMGMVLKGIGLVLTNAHPISPTGFEFMQIANSKAFGVIPTLVVIMAVVVVVMHVILRYTQFGRSCYAVGGNYDVAVYGGINARKVKWTVYVISGSLAALGGVLNSSLLNAGSAIYGDTTSLLVHCGAVIGGTSLMGGIGGIPQTTLGLLSLAILQNCMNTIGITSYIQQLIQGIVIVVILWLDCYTLKRKREAV